MSNDAPRFDRSNSLTISLPDTGARPQTGEILGLAPAISRTRDWLLAQQHEDGHWCAELEGDSILESEYLLLLAFLSKEQSPIALRAAESLRRQQAEHGGWAMFPGGPVEISGSVKAYLALKIMGDDPQSPPMQRARAAILQAGGVEKVNSFTRYYLAMLGLIPYESCPAVPPEVALLPRWFPINIYEMSAWSRTIVVPLSLLWAKRPTRQLPASCGLEELYASPQRQMPRDIEGVNHEGSEKGWINWTWVFRKLDHTIKACERIGFPLLRPKALRTCERWILDRLELSDGLGAIFPPIVWTIIGLRSLGYADDHPVIVEQLAELDRLMIHEADTTHLQPCKSPVWDTAIATIALHDAGVSQDHPAFQKSIRWLLDRQVNLPGDWQLSHPKTAPGGWYFEYRNEFYPDIDDTAMVLMALARALPEGLRETWQLDLFGSSDESCIIEGKARNANTALQKLVSCEELVSGIRRGARWLKDMQSRDGGWAAFDSDNVKDFLTKVPFADHNAMIDPSTSDITSRVLEAFSKIGASRQLPEFEKALEFVWKDQQPDFSWFGRWGVNYMYGTWQVLQGLTSFGISADDPRLRRGVQWLKLKQQANGGWGETAASYDDPSLAGQGETTPSQTAWGLLGLIAAGEAQSDSVRMGIEYLLNTQQPDGTWEETPFTGTGFPRVFYLKYHYYRIYFPLMALSRYQQAIEE